MTREPGPMGPELVERLRAHGLDDVAILEAANLIAFFNYINRVVDALGVQVEDRRPKELHALARW
jgi:alkylhydroperoxidase family enzyme